MRSRASLSRHGAGPSRKLSAKPGSTWSRKELGITIKEDTTSGVADIRAQVASGRPTWDLSTQGAHTCGILEKEGKLEKLDAAIVNDAGVPKDLKTDYWISQDRLFDRHRLAREGLQRQAAGRLGRLLGYQEFPGSALHAASPDLQP